MEKDIAALREENARLKVKLARCVEALEWIAADGHEECGGVDEPYQCKPCCAACHAIPALDAAKGGE